MQDEFLQEELALKLRGIFDQRSDHPHRSEDSVVFSPHRKLAGSSFLLPSDHPDFPNSFAEPRSTDPVMLTILVLYTIL